MLLGDQGAEVTKIEFAPDGDPARTEGPRWGEEGIAFLAANRNKRSVLLDLDRQGDRAVMRRLVAEADVFVGTQAPAVAASQGTGWSQLSALNPRLVYCSITGQGETGRGSGSASSSATAEAQSGLMSLTGERSGPPVNIGVPLVENLAGIVAKDAITAALLARETSGRGQKIETSLLETALAVLGMPASAFLLGGLVAGRWGAEHEWHVPWKTFATRDGHVVIACSSEDQWHKICGALRRPDLAADPRFATMQARAANRHELYAVLDQVFADPQVLHRAMVERVQHSALGPIAQVGHAQKFSATPCSIRLPPPTLGEHTAAVLKELDASA
jgi:crotonobetainyl-CoA:carnitine CoA-transferase CaiB-like acyl-CoA transferase